MAMLQKL